MNILIIGANGFTGRRMLDDLVSSGKAQVKHTLDGNGKTE